jgi:signal transduction histidine kinase
MDISNIFTRILSKGAKQGQSQFEKRRVLFFNIIILFLIFSCLAMILIAHHWHSKLLNTIGLVVFLFLYFYHGIKPHLAVLLLGLFYQVFIFIHAGIIDVGGQVEFGILAMTAIVPVFFRNWWAYYFLVTNVFVFYYPYIVEHAYDSFFKLAYIFAATLFFILKAFIRENEKYEQELIEKQRELKELNNEKNHLIQVVAHDLKSPLSQIEGWINVMNMSKPDASTISDYLRKIIDSTNRMSNMIMKILDVERIEKRELLKPEPIQIVPLLKHEVEQFKVLADKKDIKINIRTPETTAMVNGDIHYLEQTFHNLLSNAIKFSPRGKQVYIEVTEKNGKLIISFIDEGPGISAKDQDKLFLKFQRLTAKPTANEHTTGLGLAIAKSFVEAMDGKITCNSQLGNGATFTIELPVITQPV